MSKVVNTKQQLEKLVSLMEQNPQLAKGILTKVRTTAKWIKIWADMKSKTKKKIGQNKSEYRATGGGPNNLQVITNIEEAVIGLLQLEACVNPPGVEFGLDVTDNDECVDLIGKDAAKPNQATTESTETDDEHHNFSTTEKTPRKKRTTGKCTKAERIKLLEMQTNAQKSFHEEMLSTMKEIKDYTKKMYYLKKNATKEILQMKKEKLRVYKDEVQKMQKDRKSKL